MNSAPYDLAKQPIGIFDSGVGGLSVLDVLRAQLPHEQFIYLGDTAFVPYGEKPLPVLEERIKKIVAWFQNQHRIKALVVACNTSAANFDFSQFNCITIDPMSALCQPLATDPKLANYRSIVLLATSRTVESQAYPKTYNAAGGLGTIQSIASTDLAKMVENDEINTPRCQSHLESILAPLKTAPPDALILGCTHYPFAANAIQNNLPEHIALLDPAHWMGESLAQKLKAAGLLNPSEWHGPIDYVVTGEPAAFKATAKNLPLKHLDIDDVSQINL